MRVIRRHLAACVSNFTRTHRCGITRTRISRFALERRARRFPPYTLQLRHHENVDAHADTVRFPGHLTLRPGSQKASLTPGVSYKVSPGVPMSPAAGEVLTQAVTRRHRCLRRCAHEPSLVATGREDAAAAEGVHPAALEPGAQVRRLRLRRCFLKAQCGKKTRIQHRGELQSCCLQSSGSIWVFNPLYPTSATMTWQAPPTSTLAGHGYIKILDVFQTILRNDTFGGYTD